MEQDEELRTKFTRVLGLYGTQKGALLNGKPISWEEIFAEIGKLQERANRPVQPIYPINQPISAGTSQVHYHNGSPCYKNPCVWC